MVNTNVNTIGINGKVFSFSLSLLSVVASWKIHPILFDVSFDPCRLCSHASEMEKR